MIDSPSIQKLGGEGRAEQRNAVTGGDVKNGVDLGMNEARDIGPRQATQQSNLHIATYNCAYPPAITLSVANICQAAGSRKAFCIFSLGGELLAKAVSCERGTCRMQFPYHFVGWQARALSCISIWFRRGGEVGGRSSLGTCAQFAGKAQGGLVCCNGTGPASTSDKRAEERHRLCRHNRVDYETTTFPQTAPP